MERLAALVPRPRAHVVRYHGILGPCASDRDRVVPAEPAPRIRGTGPSCPGPPARASDRAAVPSASAPAAGAPSEIGDAGRESPPSHAAAVGALLAGARAARGRRRSLADAARERLLRVAHRAPPGALPAPRPHPLTELSCRTAAEGAPCSRAAGGLPRPAAEAADRSRRSPARLKSPPLEGRLSPGEIVRLLIGRNRRASASSSYACAGGSLPAMTARSK
jgi:hypothetical protein